MPGLPHYGLAAVFFDIVEQRLRTLDLGDHRRARPFGQYRAGKEHHQLITPAATARFIQHADPISIAVERESDIGVVGSNGLDQIEQVFCDRWVGMMIRKTGIGVGIETYKFDANTLIY